MASCLVTEGISFDVVADIYHHPWFVISAPTEVDPRVVSVNLTSFDASTRYGQYNDPACVFHVGEHSFIGHDTCVCYADAHESSIVAFESRISCGKYRMRRDPADDGILEKMRKGARNSPFFEGDYLDILREQGLV